MTELSIPRRLDAWVAEYDTKVAQIPEALAAFEEAGNDLKRAAVIQGTWGDVSLSTGHVGKQEMALSLRRSAWHHTWAQLKMETIASARDKAAFTQAMADPPAFDVDTLLATFGPYLQDPRGSILRGLAEVFASLDPAFKSHEKMKIGVKGLPKRVIISNWGNHYSEHGGRAQTRDILNALAAYQGKPLLTNAEMTLLTKDGEALRDGGTYPDPFQNRYERERTPEFITVIGRGIWVKHYQNGNAHLYFGPEALRDVNAALSEFYGEVLPDCYDADEARPEARTKGTAVSKDLQFYPTPAPVISRIISSLGKIDGKTVLEPSCGDGRIMDALRMAGARVSGVEFDAGRANQARAKGHKVITDNFLTFQPHLWRDFDMVVMNPPFSGKHYAKHVTHACQFLKSGGSLIAILPVTAETDHGLLGEEWAKANGMKLSTWHRNGWESLPVGSFAESGTNINTVIFRAFKI